MSRVGAAAGFACVLIASPALAGTFDASGAFSFDAAAVARERFDASTPLQTGLKIVTAKDALEGGTFGNVSTQQSDVLIKLTIPQINASYRARMFVRGNRVVADLDVAYPSDGGSLSFGARMFPTGLVTSDGWYEISSNPFSIEGSRKPAVTLSMSASGADVDAFELVPEGTFKALSKCAAPHDPICRSNEFCATGWCRSGDAFLPDLPPIQHRSGVVDYLAGRMRIFFGGRFTRENRLPAALATLERAKTRVTPWEFWNDVATAIHQLEDWHTTINGPVWVGGRGALPVCFVEGDADLSHSIVPKDPKYHDVLVSHTGPKATSGLKPGDRIVAINGVHPIAFVEGLYDIDWSIWRANDPETHAESVERMPSIIRRWANTFTVIRCDPKTNVCAQPEVIEVANLPADDQSVGYPYCDQRPQYHLKNGPDPLWHNSWAGPFYSEIVESQTGENIWGSVWNDVYLTSINNNNNYKPMIEAFRANASGVIMDHRIGNGGTELAAEYLTTLFRTPETIAAWPGFNTTVGMYDDFTANAGLNLYSLFSGGYQAYRVGSNNPKTQNMPTAVLLARDGSASDWFPLGMKNLPNVRVFGRRTAGAFSSYYQFDYYGQLTWRMASGDLVMPDGSTRIGYGVVPDEEIVSKQSDLLAGKDTVFLRALEWIRTCQGCR